MTLPPDAPEDGSARPRALRRYRGPAVLGVVLVAIAVTIVVVIQSGRSDTHTRTTATPTTARANDAAVEFLRLVKAGGSAAYEVQYTTVGGTSAPAGAHLWRRPPLARLDAETPASDKVTESLVGRSGPVSCSRSGADPWKCVADPNIKLSTVGIVSQDLISSVSKFEVTVTDDRVAGESVRCFGLGARAMTVGTVCLTADGVPARAVVGEGRVEAARIVRSPIPDSVFDPPAPVGG